MLTLRKYRKHVRTLIDQIVFDYFSVIKHSDIGFDGDLTEFSAIVYNLYDESYDIIDFISNVKNALLCLELENKPKVLLKHLDELYTYEVYARKELNHQS